MIPEASAKGQLPPLILQRTDQLSEYMRFMGSSPNLDTENHHFVLDYTEICLDTPDLRYSFSIYFDLITRANSESPIPDARFNLAQLTLVYTTPDNIQEELLTVTWDLVFHSIQQYFSPGIGISGIETLCNTAGFYYLGVVSVRGAYSLEGSSTNSIDEISKQVIITPTGSKSEILNVPGSMYTTLQTDNFNYIHLLSPQMFIFKVESRVC